MSTEPLKRTISIDKDSIFTVLKERYSFDFMKGNEIAVSIKSMHKANENSAYANSRGIYSKYAVSISLMNRVAAEQIKLHWKAPYKHWREVSSCHFSMPRFRRRKVSVVPQRLPRCLERDCFKKPKENFTSMETGNTVKFLFFYHR